MRMKPRTFRRVILLGSLGGIVLLGLFGYFVVRPWQNHRQLEQMRLSGVEAYERGDYIEAVKQLGRYNKNAENSDPELVLMFARARLKFQTNDGGHVYAAMQAYRDYLREVPDDREAKRELLPLFNRLRMFVEAQTLAEELIADEEQADIEVLRNLFDAMSQQLARNEALDPVIEAIYTHPESTYSDADLYYRWLAGSGREDEISGLIEERAEQFPERLDEQLLLFQNNQMAGLSNTEVLNEVSGMIGLNPETREWADDAPEISSAVAYALSRLYNGVMRHDLSLEVQLRSARTNGDYGSVAWSARRLYWTGDDERLWSLDIKTEEGEPDPDVTGYQYLAALRADDTERANQYREQMDRVVLDRRGNAWRAFIKGETALREGRLVDARIAFTSAHEIYQIEPMYRYRLGEVHQRHGRMNEAIEQWVLSNRFANGELGTSNRMEIMGWIDPLMRIIEAYTEQDRLVEATEYIDELERVGANSTRAAFVALQSRALLAQRGELPRDSALQFVGNWERVRASLPPNERAVIAPMSATILAMMGERLAAGDELRSALPFAQENEKLMVELLDVDARYGLGIASSEGIGLDAISVSTPGSALRLALRVADRQGDTDAGLKVIQSARDELNPGDGFDWDRVEAQYLDARGDDRARAIWDRLLEQRPDDIDLLISAAESRAFSTDLAAIDDLIARITELSSTAGKTPPNRLRLARARAMVSGEGSRTRTNRDSALAIVRSVVTAEPTNIKARELLSNILSMRPDPGVPESERFEPDRAGAVEQYVALSRQLSNRGAQSYLLRAIEQAFRIGEDDQARSLLREFVTRFDGDWPSLAQAAERYENLGDFEDAARIYERIMSNTQSTRAAISLAEIRLKQGRPNEGRQLIRQISSSEDLSAGQVFQLASLQYRYGNEAEADQLASSGERYGLTPAQAKLLYARFASLHGTPESELAALRESVTLDPTLAQSWKLLIQRQIEMGATEEAQSTHAEALTTIENDAEMMRLGMLVSGSPQDYRQLLTLPGIENNPRLRQAVELVTAYEELDESVPLDDRVQRLVDLVDRFQEVSAVQTYAVRQLNALPVNPAIKAVVAEKALRNTPGNDELMRIAGESYLRANGPEQALRVIELWRANALQDTLLSDAIAARAHLQLGQYDETVGLTDPHLDTAYSSVSIPVYREVIDANTIAKLRLGQDPVATTERLRAILAEDRDLRSRVWLGIASGVVEDHQIGADWIRDAEEVSDDDDRLALGGAWVTLAFTHRQWNPQYAQRALAHLEPLDDGDSPDTRVLMLISRAHVISARAESDPGMNSDHYARAVSLMLRAAEQDPNNLVPLLDAAQYASEGGLHGQAKPIYEQLLALELQDPSLKAMVLNNLAMTTLRMGQTSNEASEIRSYVLEATELQSGVAPYWGTRGWFELSQGELQAAEDSFRNCINLEQAGAEGWVGLAVTLHKAGEDRAEEFASALRRVREVVADQELDADLQLMLDRHGLSDLLN